VAKLVIRMMYKTSKDGRMVLIYDWIAWTNPASTQKAK